MKHKATEPQQVSPKETLTILEIAKSQLDTPGAFVEFGCYRGDTSVQLEKLLEAHGSAFDPETGKRLWIYDSFEGLPPRDIKDGFSAGTEFKKGKLFVTKREVITKFKRHNLHLPVIKKSFFEHLDPTNDLPPKIAFAFLDGDLYTSIKTSLNLITPKLAKDAKIIVHDYYNPQLQGVAKATDEWLKQNPTRKIVQQVETLAILC